MSQENVGVMLARGTQSYGMQILRGSSHGQSR